MNVDKVLLQPNYQSLKRFHKKMKNVKNGKNRKDGKNGKKRRANQKSHCIWAIQFDTKLFSQKGYRKIFPPLKLHRYSWHRCWSFDQHFSLMQLDLEMTWGWGWGRVTEAVIGPSARGVASYPSLNAPEDLTKFWEKLSLMLYWQLNVLSQDCNRVYPSHGCWKLLLHLLPYTKYTNPAIGILDFCKQKFCRPLPYSLYVAVHLG